MVNGYVVVVNGLTKQERRVLAIAAVLLLTGWATKMYRAAHPPAHGTPPTTAVMQPAKP